MIASSLSIAIPILTAGSSIMISDSITAPVAAAPEPLTTTDGASVYPLPDIETSARYNSPFETFAIPVALLPPGN